MRMIDVQKLHQIQRVNQVDPQEEVQNWTVQVDPNQGKKEVTEKDLKMVLAVGYGKKFKSVRITTETLTLWTIT